MPEPTIPTAALGAAAAAPSALAVIATALGVPAPVVIAAVLGATIAVAGAGKLELSFGALGGLLLQFCLALAFGFFGGPLAGLVAVSVAKPFVALPAGIADPICTLLLSMLGQGWLLPLAKKRFAALIEKETPQ